MILTIATSDRDINQAFRQMKWIGWLSSRNGNSMLEESCLLVVSQRAAKRKVFKELCWLASKIFREARCFVPPTEHEVGWPGSANWMFAQALTHVEQHFGDDVFFLEPDGIPLTPDWYDRWLAEWEVARQNGKSFMGALVPHAVTHMTGIAVYGRDWRELAPTYAQCPDHDAFDCYGAPMGLPHAHFTNLIQHVFKRSEPGWRVPHLGIISPNAVLFHQDKKGVLLPMLDNAHYNGEAADHPLFGYRSTFEIEKVMRKFYFAANATKSWKAGGYNFRFDPLPIIGGSRPGTFTTEFEAEQAALDHLASQPTTGIREIGVEEWEELTKKKWERPVSNTSRPLKETSNVAALLPTPSQSPAVLVAEPIAPPTEVVAQTNPEVKDINEVLKTGKVEPAKKTGGRPRKQA